MPKIDDKIMTMAMTIGREAMVEKIKSELSQMSKDLREMGKNYDLPADSRQLLYKCGCYLFFLMDDNDKQIADDLVKALSKHIYKEADNENNSQEIRDKLRQMGDAITVAAELFGEKNWKVFCELPE